MPTCEFCELGDPDELIPVWASTEDMVDPDVEPAYVGCPSCTGEINTGEPKP